MEPSSSREPAAFTVQVRSAQLTVNAATGGVFGGGVPGPMNTVLARQSRPLSTVVTAPEGATPVKAIFWSLPLALLTM